MQQHGLRIVWSFGLREVGAVLVTTLSHGLDLESISKTGIA